MSTGPMLYSRLLHQNGVAGEPSCRRDSVPRSLAGVRFGDHPSLRPTRGCPVARTDGLPVPSARPCSRVGVTQPPESPPTLVRSYRTVSPLPVRSGDRHRRSALCCPVPSDRSDLAHASTLPCGVPTFLDPGTSPEPRSPERLTGTASVSHPARSANSQVPGAELRSRVPRGPRASARHVRPPGPNAVGSLRGRSRAWAR